MVSPTGDADAHPYVAVPASKSGETVYVYLDPEVAEALPGKLSIGANGYAQMWMDGTTILLHRWIMNVPRGTGHKIMVDHINRNRTDCRRSNLRLVSPTESNLNRTIAERDLPVGVYRTRSGRYSVNVKRRRISVRFGVYDTAEQAAARLREVLDNPDLFEQGLASRQTHDRISLEQADEIRLRYAQGGITQVKLAEEYGINKTYIQKIVSGTARVRKSDST